MQSRKEVGNGGTDPSRWTTVLQAGGQTVGSCNPEHPHVRALLELTPGAGTTWSCAVAGTVWSAVALRLGGVGLAGCSKRLEIARPGFRSGSGRPLRIRAR
jgi:hypothetical protein